MPDLDQTTSSTLVKRLVVFRAATNDYFNCPLICKLFILD